MTASQVLLHVFNFFLPALAVAGITGGLMKLVWRHALAHQAWWRLAAWGAVGGCFALLAGLVISGRDGRMGTYLGLVVMNALAMGLAAFKPWRR